MIEGETGNNARDGANTALKIRLGIEVEIRLGMELEMGRAWLI